MRGRIAALAAAALLGAAGIATGAAVAAHSGEALPGTTVDGVDVGGLSEPELRAEVEQLAQGRATGELVVTAGDERAAVPRELVEVDVAETVQRALEAGRSGLLEGLLGPLSSSVGLTGGDEVDLVLDVDQARLRTRIDELAAQIDVAAHAGGFALAGATVQPRPSHPGRRLDRTAAAIDVRQALAEGREEALPLPVDHEPSPTTPGDVDRVVAEARQALSAPYVLTHGERSLRLTPAELAPVLASELVDGRLTMTIDDEALRALVVEEAAALEEAPREAGFEVLSDAPTLADKGDVTWSPQPALLRVLPGSTGIAVDVGQTATRLAELLRTGPPPTPAMLPLETTEPELTTEEAETAGVDTLVGTFTSYFTAGQPRATNIQRIAELVDGTYLAPGEVLSLNDTAGRRTAARGFVADGAIVDGKLTDEVGGGVSQFATTLFNAAFFAGLPIVEHKPHSFYISRYPAGRESTVYYGAIDVKIRNDTDRGIWVDTSSTPGSVTVDLYGDNGGRTVSAVHGPRDPREDGGFRIAVTRTITGGDGRGERRVFTTSYDPPPKEETDTPAG